MGAALWRLDDGEDWLYRPVLRGCLDGARLFDGSIDLEGVARLNQALDVMDHNEKVIFDREKSRQAKR